MRCFPVPRSHRVAEICSSLKFLIGQRWVGGWSVQVPLIKCVLLTDNLASFEIKIRMSMKYQWLVLCYSPALEFKEGLEHWSSQEKCVVYVLSNRGGRYNSQVFCIFLFFPLVKPIASDTFKTREVFSATRENRSWRIKFQFPSCPQVSSGECSSGCWGVVSLLLCAGAQSQANVLKFILFYLFFSGPFGKLGTLFPISQYELWYLDTIVLSIGLFFPHSVNIITFGFCFLFFFRL